ncbi:MAG: hypothetical protein ACRDS0_28980 [Pseudonocardiaceae bacterium]
MERPQPRTLLERLIQEDDRSLEEVCEKFDQCARDSRERKATLSVRQLSRWMAGAVDTARPGSRRVAQRLWGHTFRQLLGPPDVSTEVIAQAGKFAAVEILSKEEVQQESGKFSVSLQEEVVMAAEESARFVRRAGVAVTPEVLEQLDSDVRSLAVEYKLRPLYTVFRPSAWLRRDVFEMIDRHPRPTQLVDLYRVASQLSALLAHASSGLGQPYAADSHARTALLCADLAGDETLYGFIRWVQSNIAYRRGDYQDAADLAQSGQRVAGQGNDLLRLASQEARALAATGNERETSRALDIATNVRDQATEDTHLPGVFYFAPGVAAYNASDTRLALGGEANARLAAAAAQEALDLFATPEGEHGVENFAIAQLDLATAQLSLNNLDGASAYAQAAFHLPSEHRSVPIIARMNKIDQMLAGTAFSNATLASDLREQIAVFSAYPAARELPQLPSS